MGLTFFSVMAQEREKKLTNEEERVISLEETVLISFSEEPAPQTVSSFVFSHTEAETLPTQASGIEIIDTLEINDQIVSLVQSNIGETQEELIARLQNSYPNAEIQPNYRYEVFSSFANDPEYHKLRALKNIGWERALQALSTQSLLQPPLIAVIDLGIDYRHPDLKNQMRDGEKCLDKNGNFWGDCKHGASFILSGVYFSGTNPVGTRLEDKDPLPATMVPDPYNS